MDSYQLPARDRWDGWVTFAWVMVGLALIVGMIMVGAMGTVEIPEQDYRGNVTWTESPNFVVWGAAIGQVVGAAMLAAIFSILNSIYKNSCDMISLAPNQPGSGLSEDKSGASVHSAPEVGGRLGESAPDAEDGATSLIIEEVKGISPLYMLAKPGHTILKANGQPVNTLAALRANTTKGQNSLELCDESGEAYALNIGLNPEMFGVTFRG